MLTRRGIRMGVLGGAGAAMLMLGVVQVSALTDDQVKCEVNASKAVSKFAGSKSKCLNKCWSSQRKGDPTDCNPTGGRDATTQACIDAAETKTLASYDKKCTTPVGACPSCYNSGNCGTDGDDKVASAESTVDFLDGQAHCDDSASGDGLTADEGKCQDNTAKTLAKLAASLAKCTQKCWTAFNKGDNTRDCDPDGGTDATTDACQDAAEAKCVTAVNKKCGDIGATPECWTVITNGAQWCGTVRSSVAGFYDEYFCSPSGAFLDQLD